MQDSKDIGYVSRGVLGLNSDSEIKKPFMCVPEGCKLNIFWQQFEQ